jgi:hypothetical protein
MKCRECGTEIAEKALICFRCGASVHEAVTKPYVPKKPRRPLIVYVVFAILVIVALLIAFLRESGAGQLQGATGAIGAIGATGATRVKAQRVVATAPAAETARFLAARAFYHDAIPHIVRFDCVLAGVRMPITPVR